jgi:hypothetical protein
MTSVVVWYIASTDELWGVADALLSGDLTLTGSAAKILPVTIRSHTRDPSGTLKWSKDQEATVGFAYSGKALTALLTHAALNVFLGNLESDGRSLPSLRQVAELCAHVSARYVRDMGNRDNDPVADYIIYGLCPETADYMAFHVDRKFSPGDLFEHEVRTVALNSGEIAILGYEPEQLLSDIRELKKVDPAMGIRDVEPRIAIEQRIRDSKIETVGGTLQFGVADRSGFKTYASLFANAGDPIKMQYLGFDLRGEIEPVLGRSFAMSGLL